MAIFNKETKEEKQQARAERLLDRYGLESVSDESTIKALENITRTLSANKFLDVGVALSGTGPDLTKQTYLRALVEQNFIIIKQLDKLLSR